MTPPLVEFLNTLPSPLTAVLVGLAPQIATTRHLIQVLSWTASSHDSCIALALWWALCLLAEVAFRYVLPAAVLLILTVSRWTANPHDPPPPVSEDTLHKTITDLTTIHALLPASPPKQPASSAPPFSVLLRVAAILYAPYLLLTYLVPLRILLALAGTIILTWRAPWAAFVRSALWRSAYLRWSAYRLWSLLSGLPLPPKTLSTQSLPPTTAAASAPSTTALRFLFTVYENQRWWMGLDWTAALLPGERPSWCTAALQPVAPPTVFALPAPTAVYTHDAAGRRVRRTARWAWAEPEWRVAVHRAGGVRARVERPLPHEDAPGAASASASRILRAAGKVRDGGGAGVSPERHMREESQVATAGRAGEKDKSGGGGGPAGEEDAVEEEPLTDADGWVYADNKWEGGSSKGAMGKYTRYRRWTRIAVLSETVEPVGPGEVGIHRVDAPETVSASLTETTATVVRTDVAAPRDTKPESPRREDGNDQARLRRRLQAAVRSATQP